MAALRNTFTVLNDASKEVGTAPAVRFSVPTTSGGHDFQDISYSELVTDIETLARYWKETLSKNGIAGRAVIGLWYEKLGLSR